MNSIVFKGLLLIGFAIIIGAFGAHALKKIVTAENLQIFEVGVRYQAYGGFFLLIMGFNIDKIKMKIMMVLNTFFIGTLIFSISLYLLSMIDSNEIKKILGPMTPIGGSLMILSLFWITIKLYLNHLKSKRRVKN